MEITAAFYGRFSTDRQRETSIADQERVCDVRATAIGFRIYAGGRSPRWKATAGRRTGWAV